MIDDSFLHRRNRLFQWHEINRRHIDSLRRLREEKITLRLSLKADGTLEGVDAVEQQKAAILAEIADLDRRCADCVRASWLATHQLTVLDAEIKRYYDASVAKKEAELKAQWEAQRASEEAKKLEAERRARLKAEHEERFADDQNKPKPYCVWTREKPIEPPDLELPLPVVALRSDQSAPTHWLCDEMSRRERSTLQWAPWARRERKTRNRRYEGFSKAGAL